MLDLDKMVYKKIEDGAYTLHIEDWSIKATTPTDDKPAQDYVSIKATVKELNNRPLEIAVYAKGLEILASNVINFFGTEDMTRAEALKYIKGKDIPGIHETKPNPNDPAKPYRNWYLARKPRLIVDSEDEGF